VTRREFLVVILTVSFEAYALRFVLDESILPGIPMIDLSAGVGTKRSLDMRIIRVFFDESGEFDIDVSVAIQILITNREMWATNEIQVSMLVDCSCRKHKSEFFSAQFIEVVGTVAHVGDSEGFNEGVRKSEKPKSSDLQDRLLQRLLVEMGSPFDMAICVLEADEVAPPFDGPVADGNVQVLFALNRDNFDPVKRILRILRDCGIGKCFGDSGEIPRGIALRTSASSNQEEG
jgi:hypothetical protein